MRSEAGAGACVGEGRDTVRSVHLLAGLPTEAVRWGLDRVGEVMPVVSLQDLPSVTPSDDARLAILLPPFVEPASIVESWEAVGFLQERFGRGCRISSVTTFVDVDRVCAQLSSADPLSLHGWGRSDLDQRSVADIVVETVESATRIVVVGTERACEALDRSLDVLNPEASRLPLRYASGLDRIGLALAFGGSGRDRRPGGPASGSHRDRRGDRATSVEASARVVPRWLRVLRDELDPVSARELFVYRRTRPFDPARLEAWLGAPPRGVVRAKGHVWLASDPTRSFGYSCAGSVHRLFPAARWWAGRAAGEWPTCDVHRRRLLDRWHPDFGDRRQEIVFAGVDLDADELSAGLDACLLAEAEIEAAGLATDAERSGPQRARLH